MKQRELVLYGQTDSQGVFKMANIQDMNEFFKQWKNSFFTLTIEPNKTDNLSIPLLAYYKKKIVIDMQNALRSSGEHKTKEQTDYWMRSLCPITLKENYVDGKWVRDVLELEQLDNQQLVFFIEFIKDLAAQEYGFFVEEPQVLLING